MKRTSPLATVVVLSELRRDLERLVQEVLAASETRSPLGGGDWRPCLDVVEQPDRIVVVAEVPGLGPDDLQLEIEPPVVRLRGRRPPRSGSGVHFLRMERPVGTFERQLEVFQPVDFGRARAGLRRGLLLVEIPRVEERRRRRCRLEIADWEGDER